MGKSRDLGGLRDYRPPIKTCVGGSVSSDRLAFRLATYSCAPLPFVWFMVLFPVALLLFDHLVPVGSKRVRGVVGPWVKAFGVVGPQARAFGVMDPRAKAFGVVGPRA